MYNQLQAFFNNGGGPCYIVSVGTYEDSGGVIVDGDLLTGLTEVAKVDEVTLIVFPDGPNMGIPETIMPYKKKHWTNV